MSKALDQLTQGAQEFIESRISSIQKETELIHIPLDLIIVEEQVRKEIDTQSKEFMALVKSIEDQGIIQPVIVNSVNDKFYLIAGERRYHACIALNKERIPARILKDLSSSDILAIQLIENIHREGLNAIDEINGYLKYCKARFNDENIEIDKLINIFITYERAHQKLKPVESETVSDIMKISRKSCRTLQNMLTLLRLPEKAQDAIRKKQITLTMGYIFSSNFNHPKFNEVFERALTEKLTKEQLKELFVGAKAKRTYHSTIKNYKAQLKKDVNSVDPSDLDLIIQEVEELMMVLKEAKERK